MAMSVCSRGHRSERRVRHALLVGALVVLLLATVARPAVARPADVEPSPAEPADSGRVLVKWLGTPDAGLLTTLGAVKVIDDSVTGLDLLGVDVYRLTLLDSFTAAQVLNDWDTVDYAEADRYVFGDAVPNDPRWTNQWGPRKVNAPAAWDYTRGKAGVRISILDTGVEASHPDISGKVMAWKDYVGGISPAYDDHGHGTKSSGVAAGNTDNSAGVAGMCWLCTIDARKVLDQTNTGLWSHVSSAVVDAAEFAATENRVGIISMSLSGSSGSTTLENAVKHAHERGSLVLASAGNTGTTDVRYPSGYTEAIAVAGSDSSDGKYSWSSHGSWWVDIAAPGCNDTAFRGATYGSFCGTSSATPLAAGAAGLLVSQGLNASQVRERLEGTAVPVPYVRAGRIDVAAAVSTATPPPPPDSGGGTPPPPSPTQVTTTFSGTLGGKTLVKTHPLTTGTGAVTATFTAKTSPLRLRVFNSTGVLLSDTQNSSGVPRQLGTLNAGAYTFEVSGQKVTYRLAVAHMPADGGDSVDGEKPCRRPNQSAGPCKS